MKAIFASAENGAFGLEGGLPWPHISEDMKYFAGITKGACIVMGRKTWETLPTLPGRIPIVISNIPIPQVCSFPYNLAKNYLKLLERETKCQKLVIIGGASLLTPDILKECTEIHHTTIHGNYQYDVAIGCDTMAWLLQLPCEVVLKTEHCTIRKYINEKH